jgi:hypothetical protein
LKVHTTLKYVQNSNKISYISYQRAAKYLATTIVHVSCQQNTKALSVGWLQLKTSVPVKPIAKYRDGNKETKPTAKDFSSYYSDQKDQRIGCITSTCVPSGRFEAELPSLYPE